MKFLKQMFQLQMFQLSLGLGLNPPRIETQLSNTQLGDTKLSNTQLADTPQRSAGERQLALEGGVLGYRLIRARRRTLGILVGDRGVEVRAPRWVGVGEVEKFLREKEKWIWQHLKDRCSKKEAFQWNDGDSIALFGQPASLDIRRVASEPRERAVLMEENRLVARILTDDGPEQLRSLVQTWLREKMLLTGTERVNLYSARLGVPTPSVRLSNARTRWGSCSASGRVCLNWRLIHMPAHLIDYVVAHEIAHLLEMNHSARFWSILDRVYPNCRDARRELNLLGRQLPEL